MKTETIVLPQAGDSLVISKFLSGFNKAGKKVFRTVKDVNSRIAVVYENGDVRCKDGDVFSVKLKHRATEKHSAQWVTVA